jgi:hypothetical protein
MTQLLDPPTDLTWTHASPSGAPDAGRLRASTWLLAGIAAVPLTLSTPASWGGEPPVVTAIPASHAISDVMIPDLNAGAQVRELKLFSGLTWAQFAGLFGVTRRAVHFWVEGGRMSADHHMRVDRIRQALARVGGSSPDETRAALFTVGPTGWTPFAELVAEANRSREGFTSERSPLGSDEPVVRVGVPGQPIGTDDFPDVTLRKW